MIKIADVQEYPRLLTLWHASVKATHHFLSEQAINDLAPVVLDHYLPQVDIIICCKDENGCITGFAAVAKNKLAMLFIDPAYQGQGLGKALLTHAIHHYQVNSLDVNEQNSLAVGFYLKQGFQIIGRSALDGQGNPYPLLHMHLANKP